MTGGVHFIDAAAPAGLRIYAIGDVHGRLDCLTRMHELIAEDIAADRPEDWRIVHLGDYIDRGPDSRGVVDLLSRLCRYDSRVIALAGNHDEGILEFLADPNEGGLFLNHGGFETAASYGVTLDAGTALSLAASHRALVRAVPDAHVAFLAGLPASASFGDFFYCHAGIRPGIPLDAQERRDLIWIRRDFLDHQGLHEKVVVHGHTPVAEAQIRPNRVNVDTMAFDSGRLSALVVESGRKRIVTAISEGQ